LKTKGHSQVRRPKRECAILEVIFPKVRAEIVRLLFSAPPKQRYVRELVAMSGLALSTVQDELHKLNIVGLVTSWSNRYQRFYQANRNHPLFPELVRIVQVSARLPRTKHSALHRQRHSRSRTRSSRRRAPTLPSERAINWHLFSGPGKT